MEISSFYSDPYLSGLFARYSPYYFCLETITLFTPLIFLGQNVEPRFPCISCAISSRSLNNEPNFSPSFLRGVISFCFPFDDNARNRYAATSGTAMERRKRRWNRAKRSNCFFSPPLHTVFRCASISPFPRTYVTLKSAFTTHRSNDLRFQRNLSLSSQQWRGLDNVKDDRCYLRLFLTKPGARKPRSNNTY